MVRSDHLIAVSDVGPRAEEKRTIIRHVLQKPIGLGSHHLHVFGADPFGFCQLLIACITENDFTIIAPGDARHRRGVEPCEYDFDRRRQLFG